MPGMRAPAPTGRSVGVSLYTGGQPAHGLGPRLRLDQVVPVEDVLLEPARPHEPCLQPRCEAGGVEEPTLLPRSAAIRVRLEEKDLTVLTETINACVHGTAPGQDRYDAFGPLRVLHSNGRHTPRPVFANDAGARTKQWQQSTVRTAGRTGGRQEVQRSLCQAPLLLVDRAQMPTSPGDPRQPCRTPPRDQGPGLAR